MYSLLAGWPDAHLEVAILCLLVSWLVPFKVGDPQSANKSKSQHLGSTFSLILVIFYKTGKVDGILNR